MNTSGNNAKTTRRKKVAIAGVVVIPLVLSAGYFLRPNDDVQINQTAHAGSPMLPGNDRAPLVQQADADPFQETRSKLDECLAKQAAPTLGADSSDQDQKLFALMKQRCSIKQNLRNLALVTDFDNAAKSPEQKPVSAASKDQAEKLAQAARAELKHVDASIQAVQGGEPLPEYPKPVKGEQVASKGTNVNPAPAPVPTKSELNRYRDKAFSECMLRYGHSVASVDDFKRRYLDPIAGPGANAITATSPEMKKTLSQYLKCSRESSDAALKKQDEGMR